MRYGIITAYFEEKGFGFIKPDVGQDVFFHVTALGACEEFPQITLGQPVKFELEPKKRTEDDPPADGKDSRRRAKMVELIDKLPGGQLEDDETVRAKRHPKARRKKASWRAQSAHSTT